jgi:enoyl-CoA hydratase
MTDNAPAPAPVPADAPSDASTAEPPAVLTERRGNVLLITLNRPHVRNAVDGAVAEGVAHALDELDADEALSVGILTGAGGFFCAGMDLGAFVRGESPYYGDRGFAGIAQRASRKPLIAAIEGFAVAGGMEIALACDLIVAAKGAKLGIPEAKRSLVAAAGALLRLPRRMPYHVVMELALTGDTMPAERFHEHGVVNRLAEPGGAVDAALELAAAIAKNGPLALAASKQILQEQFDWSTAEMWERQGVISGPVFASEDAKEGASAFKEKREPVWRGR